jgi:hypothetical protein
MRHQSMKRQILAVMCTALLGVCAASGPALSQQKTVKACQDEWRANKDANQAAGITERAYVDKCRVGAAVAAPAATPAATPAAAPVAGQKTVKACQGEWRASKDAFQAGGVTEKAYVDKCRAGETVAIPSAGAAAARAQTPAVAPAARPAPTPASLSPPSASAPSTNGTEFTAELQAKSHCPTDTVVWANLDSKIYHFSGNKNYGTTKEGAYMCEKDALAQGVRAPKNEKHP